MQRLRKNKFPTSYYYEPISNQSSLVNKANPIINYYLQENKNKNYVSLKQSLSKNESA